MMPLDEKIMALITCPECSKEISDQAKTCPNCGAKPPKSKALLMALLGIPIIFVTWALVRTPSPEEEARAKDRNVIEACWEGQKMASNTPGQARSIAMMCEQFERDFVTKYGRNP